MGKIIWTENAASLPGDIGTLVDQANYIYVGEGLVINLREISWIQYWKEGEGHNKQVIAKVVISGSKRELRLSSTQTEVLSSFLQIGFSMTDVPERK